MITIKLNYIEMAYVRAVLNKHYNMNGIINNVAIREIDANIRFSNNPCDNIRTHYVALVDVLELAIINNSLINEITEIIERFNIINDNLKYIDEL